MSCSGLHCSGCAGGASVPVVALLALEGFAWVAAHVIEVAVVSAVCAVLAAAAVAALIRRQDRRQARCGTLAVTRPDAAPLPPARRAGLPPVVSNYYYFYVADPVVAARVRQALPVTVTQLPRDSHGQGPA